jgi:hypothetical protein
MLTRKDFNTIASHLKTTRNRMVNHERNNEDMLNGFDVAVVQIASALKDINPKFNKHAFYAAISPLILED